MAELPAPRERRTAKVVIYVTPGDHEDLAALAQYLGMSVSEFGGQTLRSALDNARCLQRQIGDRGEEPLPEPAEL